MQGKQKSAHNMQFGTCKMSVVPLGDSLDSLLLHTLLVHNIPHDVLSLVDELWCANMLCYIVRSLRRTNIGHPLTLLLMCCAQWGQIIFFTLISHFFSVKLLVRGDFLTSKQLLWYFIHTNVCAKNLMLHTDEGFFLLWVNLGLWPNICGQIINAIFMINLSFFLEVQTWLEKSHAFII